MSDTLKQISSCCSVATAVSVRTVKSSHTLASSTTTFSRARTVASEKEIRSRLLARLGIYDPCRPLSPTSDNDPSSPTSIPSGPPPNPATSRKADISRGLGLGGVFAGTGRVPTAPLTLADAVPSRYATRLCGASVEPLKYSASPPVEGPMSSLAAGARVGSSSSSPPIPMVASESKKQERRQRQRRGRSGSAKTIAFNESVSVIGIPERTEYSSRVRSRIWSDRYEIQTNAARNAVEFAAEGWDWRTVTEDDGMYVCTASGELVHPAHCQQHYRQADLGGGGVGVGDFDDLAGQQTAVVS